MKLEVGKRYVLRNGEVTGKLLPNGTCMSDGVLGVWTSTGYDYNAQEQSEFDIVAEYVEPQPQQPLRWVENCKPDKPGIWATQTHLGTDLYWLTEKDWPIMGHATRCYLGPIPEILPPKKKAVERLWLLQHGISTYAERWVPDDRREELAGDWIRTDRTREVER